MRRLHAPLLLLAAACAGATTPQRIPVPPGATVRAIADSLAAHRIIRWKALFRWRARLAHADRDIKAGVYEIAPGTSTAKILHALRTGDGVHFRVTLPAGGTIVDLARSAEHALGIPSESTLAAARDTAIRREFHVPGPSVEGWLLPETFEFMGFANGRDVVRRFAEARRSGWDSAWTTEAAHEGLTPADVLSLASIVEAEALDSTDVPLIAAVYRNRLRMHMALQADPTIQYAYLLEQGARKPRLYDKDYLLDSPWNTYRNPGLPPGPIGNPTRAAIEAVLHPANVPYVYFVAGPDGKHVFSRTYAEHLRSIRRVRGG